MCGIITAYTWDRLDDESLDTLVEKISHRGDQEPTRMTIDKCFMAMSRLAIVDRENAVQPMTNEDETLYIVFNGEIYNHRELKYDLEKYHGHSFRTDSDTEVIIHAYEEWGEDSLHYLDGQFAFVIFNRETNEIFAARDPLGIKPLYYAYPYGREGILFASEMKALTHLAAGSIDRLPPGWYTKTNPSSAPNTKTAGIYFFPEKVFNPDKEEYEKKEKAFIGDVKSKLRHLFDRAVAKRVQTDLPIAVLLSGGIDSSLVLKYAMKHHPDVTAFCIGREESEDMVYARRIAKDFDVELVTVDPAEIDKLMIDNPEELIYACETFEPNHVNSMALTYAISKKIHEAGIKVALAGEGADELFAGYDEFRAIRNRPELQAKMVSYIRLLNRTQLQRVDRMSMANQVEVRVPFLDMEFAKYAMKIDPFLKILLGQPKWILREAFRGELPDYILDRGKNPFGVGARLSRNTKDHDAYADSLGERLSDVEFMSIRKAHPEYALLTKTEAYCFKIYNKHFSKAGFNKERFGMLPR